MLDGESGTTEAGTEAGADGTPGDAGGQTGGVDSGNPPGESSNGDKSGTPATPQAARSLDELIEAAENDMSTLSVEERRKYIKAGKYGLKSEAEFEAKFGKAKTAGPPEGEEQALPGQAKPGAKPIDKNKPATPAAGDLSFLKEALPTIDITKPTEVVKSIKELQGHATRLSQSNSQMQAAYGEIEQGLLSRLNKGQDGIKELYAQMGVAIPEWLGASAPAAAAGARPAAAPAGPSDPFAGLEDTDFVPVSSLKASMAAFMEQATVKAVADAMAKVEATYGPIKQSHEAIQAEVARNAQTEQVKATRAGAWRDADLHSDMMGMIEPTMRLTEKADKIWAASIGADGKLLSEPHPEFATLQKILSHRRTEYIDKGHPAANYKHYLLEIMHDSGKLQKYWDGQKAKAQQDLLTAQQRRVQPSLVNKGVNGGPAGMNGLRMPKSVEDVTNMKPEDRRAFRQMATRGKLAV